MAGVDAGGSFAVASSLVVYFTGVGAADIVGIVLCGRFGLYFNLVSVSGCIDEEPLLYTVQNL